MASNLTQATRELIDRTWKSAVSYGSPLLTRLIERKQVQAGGTQYEQMFESSDMRSLVQEYGPNDGLVGGSKEFIERPHWHTAYMQVPLEENVDERVMNAPKSDAQLLHIAKKNATRGVTGLKMQIAHRMYGNATDTEVDTLHTYLQGLPSALMEDTVYGGLTRTASSSLQTPWQAAMYATWETAYAINKYNIDTWLDACMEYAQDRGDYLVIMGDTLWNRLKGIFEASNVYVPKANKATQGFESMEYNGVEIAKDFLLDRMLYTGATNNQETVTLSHRVSVTVNAETGTNAGLTGDATYAGTQYVFVLDLKTWHLMYFHDKNDTAGEGPFAVTDYFDQSKVIGGQEKYVARAKFKGNLICSMPNRNLMRAHVS